MRQETDAALTLEEFFILPNATLSSVQAQRRDTEQAESIPGGFQQMHAAQLTFEFRARRYRALANIVSANRT
jgi:hypothetical protein